MTPEEFEALFKPGGKFDFLFKMDDGLRLANAVADLDESQRRKLSKTASQFYQRTANSRMRSENRSSARWPCSPFVRSAKPARSIRSYFIAMNRRP